MDKNTQQPVAWQYSERVWVPGLSDYIWRDKIDSEKPAGGALKDLRPLYADQPAPPVPRDVLMAVAQEVLDECLEYLDGPSGRIDISAIADRYATQQASIADLGQEAARYRWLRDKMLGVDFDWNDSGLTALCFEMPDGCAYGGDCDQNIDAAMQK